MQKSSNSKQITAESPVIMARGISKIRAGQLEALGVLTCGDLVKMYPRTYEDRSNVRRICELAPGMKVTVKARVLTFTTNRYRKNLTVTVLKVSDGTGFLNVTFFNRDYVTKQLRTNGESYYFYGEIESDFRGRDIIMKSPVIAPVGSASAEGFTGILPVYRLTKDLTQTVLRKAVKGLLDDLPPFEDYLPKQIIGKYGLCPYDFAIRKIHFPGNEREHDIARKRLAFDELLFLQLMIRGMRNSLDSKKSTGIVFPSENNTDRLLASLPFTLSDAQKKVWNEIKADMEKPQIMNRLILGDVGSGKTVLAELAMVKAISAGYQALFMAPTEILAAQHAKNIDKLFSKLGIKTVLLTGSLTAAERREALSSIASGEAQCVVGTHALIQKNVEYKNVGIVITDEQHRFGVHQRASLAANGKNPDILIMSATPIPRTLALSLYGDMDVSYVDVLPKGRLPVKTYKADESMRTRVYTWAAKLASQGNQVYIVHPLISSETEDGEALSEAAEAILAGLLSAEENYASASKTFFRGLPTALIHGKMTSAEKDAVMRDFTSGKTKILFSTTVIEVGVDVAGANLIIIENAERFGLAQLHQLRGRVGRSSSQAFCVLMSDNRSTLVSERLDTMCKTANGFEIAEKDLALRGPGDFFGTAQHGLPQLQIANLYEDIPLLKSARDAANEILSSGSEKVMREFGKMSERINGTY